MLEFNDVSLRHTLGGLAKKLLIKKKKNEWTCQLPTQIVPQIGYFCLGNLRGNTKVGEFVFVV